MRWWGLAGGVLLAAVDTLTAVALGFTFEVNGRDATVLAGLFFGSSFALLGFLVGYVVEGRQRDREAGAIIQAQSEALQATHSRLAQSEKLAALGQLATAIAHEVRNPLAIMRSAAQGMLEGTPPPGPEAVRACTFIIAEIDRLSNVVTSLLAFARPLQLRPRRIDVDELLGRTAALAREEYGDAVRLVRDQAGRVPHVHGDPDLVCQVLLGLVANAIEASPPGAEVRLGVHASDDGVELAVVDAGPGVAPDVRERIFEPFFTTRERGTGLGLAVARQIVQAHGGTIAVGDAPGGGARFMVRLRAARDMPEAA
jgi:two-component system sensor histidine kinase HydH